MLLNNTKDTPESFQNTKYNLYVTIEIRLYRSTFTQHENITLEQKLGTLLFISLRSVYNFHLVSKHQRMHSLVLCIAKDE